MPLKSNCPMMPAWYHCVPKSGHVEESEAGGKMATICDFQVYSCIGLTKQYIIFHYCLKVLPSPTHHLSIKSRVSIVVL